MAFLVYALQLLVAHSQRPGMKRKQGWLTARTTLPAGPEDKPCWEFAEHRSALTFKIPVGISRRVKLIT